MHNSCPLVGLCVLLHSRHLCHLLLDLVLCGHVIEDVVQELQCPVEPYLHPAGRLLDALPAVVRAPPLDKAKAEDAESPKVVYTHSLVLRGGELDATGVELAYGRGGEGSGGARQGRANSS